MKKYGFTLVELLAVLAVLGILMTIIAPSVSHAVKNSRVAAYEKQIQILTTATEKWGTEHLGELPDRDSDKLVTVDFRTLYQDGEITSYPLTNPTTGEELEGCIVISYSAQYKQYEYKYSDNLTICNNYHYANN